jgi:hypothetical protein
MVWMIPEGSHLRFARGYGVIARVEIAFVDRDPIANDPCQPLAASFHKIDPGCAASVISVLALVSGVFSSGRKPKICDSIIAPVMVYVVNFTFGPCSVNKSPYYSMSLKNFAEYRPAVISISHR